MTYILVYTARMTCMCVRARREEMRELGYPPEELDEWLERDEKVLTSCLVYFWSKTLLSLEDQVPG